MLAQLARPERQTELVLAAERGYWCEALLHHADVDLLPDPRSLSLLPDPMSAIRLLRLQLRQNAPFGLDVDELARAAAWLEDGWVHALGALARNEPCGFRVKLPRGEYLEWVIRPVNVYPATPTGLPTQHPTARRDLRR
ncbi:hypothetical protein AB0I68_24960 [Streptomyces sp. NPDC050448]|uniref:hypothetical protein n=1 Tax=Streptomyces sp. NPDC050448 TaxID=3155404 RepID=UPI00342BA826